MRHALLCILLLALPALAAAADYTVDVNTDKAFRGTTLFAETMDPKHPRIVEVDMDGAVVWEYAIPTEIVRGGHPGQAMDIEWIPETDTILFVMPLKGIYEVDRNKQIVWKHLTKRVSHDADKLPNGNILYSFAWERENDTQVFEITPDGKEVWHWRAVEHIAPSERRHKGPVRQDGFCHVNGVMRLDNGQTRISMRNFNMAVEVDQKGTIVWSLRELSNGKEARNIHDPRTLPNGNIILSTHGPQRIFEVTRDGRLVNCRRDKNIHLVRSHQVLPNGNILCTDADKLMELTPDLREIVWQLRKPGVDIRKLYTKGKVGPGDPREVGFYKAERIPPRQ
ncbi:aryl-sulfate sulfotransferase [Salidesulfovibrio onnuriiensis]|uniref:aryl-sulfate sulfotransferase n=1 Tax=Salidesulfovibrio onnuriiensis TaxID=2583823 RepID=UPI0011CABA90|nr:aryl-sulfate sulfotransferase [Salidesulfovibrio onnuriiensis]